MISAQPLFLDSIDGETALLRAVIQHRLIGPQKHFNMISVMGSLKDTAGQAYDSIPAGDIWRKVNTFWDLNAIEDTEEDEGSQEFATSEEDRTADSTGSSRHFVPFDPFTLPTLYSTYVVPRAQNRASAPPSSDGAPEVATPSAPTSARKRKEPLEEYDPAAVSDESELTEQEDEADRNDDEERDEDEEDASDAEDTPKIASKRSRSTRSVSVSADSPVAGTTGKRIKIPSAKKSAAKRPAVAKRAKRS